MDVGVNVDDMLAFATLSPAYELTNLGAQTEFRTVLKKHKFFIN